MNQRAITVSGDRLGKLEGQVEEGFKHFNQGLARVESDVTQMRGDIKEAVIQMALNTQTNTEIVDICRKSLEKNERIQVSVNEMERKLTDKQNADKQELKREIDSNKLELKRIGTILSIIAAILILFREQLIKFIGL